MSKATERRIRVGAQLRELRRAHGIPGDEVADLLGWSQAKLSRMESARVALRVEDVGALLEFYGVGDDLRAEILAAVAAEAGQAAWTVRRIGGPLARASEELSAARIRQYSPQLVPPVLQSRGYAEVVCRLAGAPDPVALAEHRVRWQAAVRASDGLRHEVVLDARALAVDLRDPGALPGQVDHLVRRAADDDMRLRVVPLGSALGAVSPVPFTVYSFHRAEPSAAVYIETPTAEVYLADPEDTERYVALFRRLAASALSVRESVRYLEAVRVSIEAGEWPSARPLAAPESPAWISLDEVPPASGTETSRVPRSEREAP